jgi:hypothetical protein
MEEGNFALEFYPVETCLAGKGRLAMFWGWLGNTLIWYICSSNDDDEVFDTKYSSILINANNR